MKLGMILQSNNPEHVWNTFRLGIAALKKGHQASIFLLNEGAELESIADTGRYDISKKVAKYRSLGGQLLACGTCLESRGRNGSTFCPVSSMDDLLALVEDSDKVLVFG